MDGKRYWDPRASRVERVPNEIVVSCEQPGIMAAPHWHAQAEVNFVFRGGVEYEMHGHRVRLEAGTVALFWGGLPHRVVDTRADTYFHAIHLPLLHFFRLRLAPELQQRLMRGATLLASEPQPDDAPAFTRRARYLTSKDARLVRHGIDELLLRLERIGLEPHEILEAADPSPGAQAEQASFQGIRRICGFIAENFREDIDCVDIAASADIHPKYAMTVFKRSTGMSLGEYVSLMRVSYAQALLTRDDASILQVAMDSGFGSVSAFNKCFRKKAGMTPSEFKREHRALPLALQA
ncbi:helix-turn-helix domain-containing protein [Rubellimicrobium aerolatum]|uniref:Helix-turn-helix domain-containing protein n=1 Tax=Rubellimicrobium aerolatum TaxID=490979 RepID=A0ABW0SGM1_9RHOB|nr:helix-turn-helix domain-containing protein [Rubellimicrobium aerolatum]MBP1807486.1 AraC-like DNA-binding protein [Rubellimicrobium aerolatum]